MNWAWQADLLARPGYAKHLVAKLAAAAIHELAVARRLLVAGERLAVERAPRVDIPAILREEARRRFLAGIEGGPVGGELQDRVLARIFFDGRRARRRLRRGDRRLQRILFRIIRALVFLVGHLAGLVDALIDCKRGTDHHGEAQRDPDRTRHHFLFASGTNSRFSGPV
jgi:hypothetical protein